MAIAGITNFTSLITELKALDLDSGTLADDIDYAISHSALSQWQRGYMQASIDQWSNSLTPKEYIGLIITKLEGWAKQLY